MTTSAARLPRLAAAVAGVWAGILVCIGAIAAPAAFATLAAADAGRLAARLFAIEAYLSLALATGLLLNERRRGRSAAATGTGSVLGVDFMLVLATLFCTVAGHFAVAPMMQAARAGTLGISFGALHAISGAFFVVKAVLVLALAWRLTSVTNAARPS